MARRTRPGRPPKPARARRTSRLHVLLTTDEHRRLSKLAQTRNASVSELVRQQIQSLLVLAEGSERSANGERASKVEETA